MGIKVSVLMITYNHERYIAQALDSVLAQDVDFDYEIVVGEDHSSDGTLRIVSEYQLRNPGRIRIVTSEANVGMHQNLIRTYRACRGDYIAMLEGDDYWTSPEKLQLQVNFLEGNPSYAICFHGVEIYSEMVDRVIDRVRAATSDTTFTLDDIVSDNMIPTCSALFRNRLIDEFPEWLCRLRMLDWPMNVLNAHTGPAMYLDKVMAMYRVHPQGVWNQTTEESQLQSIIGTLDLFIEHFDPRLGQKMRAAQDRRKLALLELYAHSGKVEPAAALMEVLRESDDPQILVALNGISGKLRFSWWYMLLNKWQETQFVLKKLRRRLREAL